MKYSILLMIVWCTVFPKVASGSGHERHGGNTVICENEKPSERSVELLDFFIAKETMIGWSFASPGNDHMEIARLAIQKLRPVNEEYVEYLNQQLKLLLTQTRFIDRSMIRNIDDIAPQVFPARHCVKKQIAVQIKNPLPGEARLLIDQQLWNEMDEKNRAGLLIHELLLKDEMERSIAYTDGVMYVVAQLFSSFFETAPFSDRIRALSPLQSSNLTYVWKGLEFKIDLLLSTDDSGLVRQGRLKRGGDFHMKNMNFGMTCDSYMPVKVNQSGQLEACFLTYSTPGKQGQIQLRGTRGQSVLVKAFKTTHSPTGPGALFGIPTTFHPSGIPTSLRISVPDAVRLGFTECGTRGDPETGDCWIRIDENGLVTNAYLWNHDNYPENYADSYLKMSVFEGCHVSDYFQTWVERCEM